MRSTQGKQEFPKSSGIFIRPVANQTNGAAYGQSYLVSLPVELSKEIRINKGKPNERRIPERKRFATLQEAKNWADERIKGVRAVGPEFIRTQHGDRDASLRLLEGIKERDGELQDVVDDVLAALKALGASSLRLTECVTFALPRLAPAKVVTVSECAESYLASLSGEVSEQYERTTRIYLSRVTIKVGHLPVSHLDAVKVNELVSGLRLRDRKGKDGKVVPGKLASPKFRQNLLCAIRRLVRFAVSRGWLAKGVVDFDVVETPRDRIASAIAIYSPDELAALLRAAAEPYPDDPSKSDADLVPFLAIGAFSGLRSAEIERLDWREIDLVNGHVEITAEKAKTASRRLAPLPENLKAWLTPLHRKSGRVFEFNTAGGRLTTRLQSLAKRAGLEGWRKNALRHSFISYRVAKVQNVSQVALEAGNSPQIVFSNYRSVVRTAEAERYFAIIPAPVASNVTALTAVA